MIDDTKKNILKQIQDKTIDINNQQSFFSKLFKSLIYDLNRNISLRDKYIPHIIINTGDDILYLESKGQQQSLSPREQTNENFIYNNIPRCILTLGGVNILPDQLTSPYTNGQFQFEYENLIYTMVAEFRRMPITTKVSCEYILDNFNDSLVVIQNLITNVSFIKNFQFDYMGQMINCTYKIQDSFDNEIQLEFDGSTIESKNKSIKVDIDIEGNIPIFASRTVKFSDDRIYNVSGEVYNNSQKISSILQKEYHAENIEKNN